MSRFGLDSEAIESQRTTNRTIRFPSRFQFLKGHLGVRPNSLHGLIAPMSSGKSSLAKAIISECAENGKILVWGSEETEAEYGMALERYNPRVLKNIAFVDERQVPEDALKNLNNFHFYFWEKVSDMQPDLVVIDNVTTSMMYSDAIGPAGQAVSTRFLQRVAKELCAVFYVAHTDSKIGSNHPGLIGNEDIRGSRILPIQTEYLYVMQPFVGGGKQHNIVRVGKFRHHESASGFFLMFYDNGKYLKDEKIPFDKVNEIFKKRDRLGAR